MNEQPQLTSQARHQIWMKNSGYLYDRLIVHRLKWPSLTFQWLPTIKYGQDGITYEILVGTHTSGQRSDEYILILEIFLPNSKELYDPDPIMSPATIKKVDEFCHEFQPNRARYSAKDPSFIAVRVDEGTITIYKRGNEFPQILLSDHVFSKGFALEWSEYGLLSGDHGGSVVFWEDIEHKPKKFMYGCEVEDTKCITSSTFGSVSDDGALCIWDTRTGGVETKVPVSNKQLYSLSINPVNKNLILTAGEQGVIKLWDTRNYKSSLYQFEGHTKSVLNVTWSMKSPTIFASGSSDSKVKIWDLLRVGFQIPKDQSGTEELLFTHQGHQDEVLDLGWNPFCMLLGSTEETYNTLQIYQISNCIQELEYVEDMEYLRDQCLS